METIMTMLMALLSDLTGWGAAASVLVIAAFDIVTTARQTDFPTTYATRFNMADATGISTVTASGQGDIGFACRHFRALVYLKQYVQGNADSVASVGASQNTQIQLITASNINFTGNVFRTTTFVPVTSSPHSVLLTQVVPTPSGNGFVRIQITYQPGSTAIGTYDALVDCTP